ncbi:MAG: leucine-rich repeat protein, partial [Bacteroidales bacterium]|nr:leucine-rich repeat protein [Candidatus Liminaster caballi]
MKKILTLLSLFAVAVCTFAQTFTIDDLTYAVLSEEDKTAQVVNGQNATGDVVVPETVTYEEVTYSVPEISYGAFQSNSNITSIAAPSIITINDYAFEGCTSLTSFRFPNVANIRYGVFQGCGAIEEAILPKVETIGGWAFVGQYSEEDWQYHSALKRLDLSSVKTIESGAFYHCSDISSLRIGSVDQWCQVNFGDGNANPLQETFQAVTLYVGDSETPAKDLVAASTLTEIPSYAFCRVSNIESFSAPAAINIGSSAFRGSALTSVNLPAATTIGSYAFQGCESLEEAIMPKVETIGQGSFSRSAITSVNLPAATTIGSDAFQGCESSEEAIMPKVETIGQGSFSRSAITSVNLPAATSIGDAAFASCTSLASINLPAATTIGSGAFQGCESLEEAIMPKVETIGNWAFGYLSYYDENGNYVQRNCKSLKRLDLSSVKSIEFNAFEQCSNISSLRIGSVDQWCQVNFGDGNANPLQQTSQAVTLYVGDSETPAKDLVASNALTEIPNYAFYRISDIESFSAPAATSIGDAAFASCTSLTSIDFPVATNIGSSAFSGTALTSV